MSDIVERLRTHCIDLEGGIRDEEILAAADEIERLRSILKEAGQALEPCIVFIEDDEAYDIAKSVLSKIKGEA